MLLYAALFGASVLVLFGVVYWATAHYMEQQIEATVQADLDALLNDGDSNHPDRLARHIEERLAAGAGFSYFLLQGSDGKRLAGNLSPEEPVTGWHGVALPSRRDPTEPEENMLPTARVWGVVLPGGDYLAVGQDTERLMEARELMVDAFGWVLVVTVSLALLGGVVMSAGFLRRVEAVNRTSREIMDGDLSQRMPVHGTNDDFDRLSLNLNDMLDRIEALMEGLRQVSNDIAHDLRTPLSRMRQRLEKARMKAMSVEEYRVAVDRAIADADTILRTFSALLRIAQIESGSRRAAFTRIDLSMVVKTIVEVYTAVAEDRGQWLQADIRQGVAVEGDRDLLTQMLANLIENALEHSPTGAQVKIALEERAGEPELSVSDNGPGIPPPERRKVFQRFYRLEHSRSTPGNGLGLSLVAAVADLHRARVDLEDNAPGLRVRVRFPARWLRHRDRRAIRREESV